jgi:hypothetical protein
VLVLVLLVESSRWEMQQFLRLLSKPVCVLKRTKRLLLLDEMYGLRFVLALGVPIEGYQLLV